MTRQAEIQRVTKETSITSKLIIEGRGQADIQTPLGFLNHLLETFTRYGCFDLSFEAKGDLQVDQHHLVEDCGIVLGKVFDRALGDRRGINRAGFFVFPMDEALSVVAVDLGGRSFLQFEADFKRRFCGALDTDLLEDFFLGLAENLRANVVLRIPFGRSDHHKLESAFKGFGRAMRMACSKDPREIEGLPSLKGIIDHGGNY
ncbi:MAG: imidazoleglycerol-phosphate dehydratase HisB [Acidobacteriota bacterium]